MARRLGQTAPEQRMPRDGFRAIGLIERPRGLKGELKVRSLTDFPERFAHGARVFVEGLPRIVLHSNWRKGAVYIYIDGVADHDGAEALRGELIEVPVDERPDTDEPFWYVEEIEGLRVLDEAGLELGCVREVLQTGANDVYVVDRGTSRDLLVPALSDVVLAVDLSAGVITVDLPDGLLPTS